MKNICAWILIVFALVTQSAWADTGKGDCREPIPEIFKRVSPSVVLISATAVNPMKMTQKFTHTMGAGFIVSPDGYIMTNAHLVLNSRSILVVLDPNQIFPALMVGADSIMDIAILKITPPPKGLSVAVLGDSDKLQTGEEVIAIGNPFGFERTLVHGVVSGINRILPVSPMSLRLPLIQTDAAINPGSSGGPLLNRCGHVVGITSSMLRDAQNMGFAVPVNMARNAMPQLIEKGRVIRPWIGVHGKLIDAGELSKILNADLIDGLLVEAVDPDSPAEAAELQGGDLPVTIAGEEYLLGGDIIFAVNGRPLVSVKEFWALLQKLKAGDEIRLGVYRDGQKDEVSLTVAERPALPWDLMPSDQDTRFQGEAWQNRSRVSW